MIDAAQFGAELAGIVKAATAPLLARIEELEKRLGALPEPIAGRDGADGQSVTVDDVMPVLQKRVDDFLSQIPIPKDGTDGADGKDGLPGERGEKGEPGRDGVGLAGAMIDREGGLVVTLTNGEVRSLGRVVGLDGRDGESGAKGADGRDGVDGLGFDDLRVEIEDHRPVMVWEASGKSLRIPVPGILDRGVWRDGLHKAGDGVTFGGSFWIAQRETTQKPGDGDDWRLAVKKGRDGKDGVMKAAREAAPLKVAK